MSDLDPVVQDFLDRPAPEGWQATALRVATPWGRQAHHGYVSDAAPGLAVTPCLHATGWVVTHIASGKTVCGTGNEYPVYGRLPRIIEFALALAKMDVRWTEEAPAVSDETRHSIAIMAIEFSEPEADA